MCQPPGRHRRRPRGFVPPGWRRSGVRPTGAGVACHGPGVGSRANQDAGSSRPSGTEHLRITSLPEGAIARAASAASTSSAPSRARRSRCSTTIGVTVASRSKARDLRPLPFSAEPISVTTPPTARPCSTALVGRGHSGLRGGPPAAIATVGLRLDRDQPPDPPRRCRQLTGLEPATGGGIRRPPVLSSRFRFMGRHGKSPDIAGDRSAASG